MHILVGVCFSSWKNTLQKSAFQKLILLQNLHSLYVHSLFCPWNSDFSSSFTVKLTTEVIMLHKDTATDLLETAFIISATTTIHHILKWIPVHGVTNATNGFSQKPASYEIFSFPIYFEVFKHFRAVSLQWNAFGVWQETGSYSHCHSQTWIVQVIYETVHSCHSWSTLFCLGKIHCRKLCHIILL